MILNMYAVRDNAVEAFLQPFFSPTTAAALRSLTEAVNDPKHDFHKHAADFALWHVGEYDDATGVVSSTGPKRVLACVDLLGKD